MTQLSLIESEDSSTRDTTRPMHMCPAGTAMTGIHVKDNRFACAHY
ncbi:hypothetical protein JY651_11655 [Pyxidicoccus parkwayensis]|uniref:Uncharacterized protein n=1 Tax=Pyxidicoccus parkwayensis TaxID=2813578 RepID=A0ABX7P527_9BACT|nr:hypothetical protein [Pyxidicoccus parkwaysis]QSQ25541.1 hypothetical protein JY651_11655 [Pyxidicoccus parkwaysis]